jgi:hypothetical protein
MGPTHAKDSNEYNMKLVSKSVPLPCLMGVKVGLGGAKKANFIFEECFYFYSIQKMQIHHFVK